MKVVLLPPVLVPCAYASTYLLGLMCVFHQLSKSTLYVLMPACSKRLLDRCASLGREADKSKHEKGVVVMWAQAC